MECIRKEQGFTLIELSIVLVIIGLIVGGVLVGQDLIRAAEIRATISQLEKYNTAVNTFRGKYNAIPGDIAEASAVTFGFYNNAACTGAAGLRDGNGLLDGTAGAGSLLQGAGETGLFWQDLSSANGLNLNLIEGSYTTATCATAGAITAATAPNYMPAAKLGRGNYFYVYETNGTNYYGLANVGTGAAGALVTATSMSPSQAFNIDNKIDDGLPLTGAVTAYGINASSALGWVGASPASAGSPNITAATVQSGTTCYDNGNTGAAAAVYSLGTLANGGLGPNCALSVRFQ